MTSSHHTDEQRIVDLTDMIETGLGHPVNPQAVRRFAESHASFESRQSDLVAQATDHLISRETYVAELDRLMQELASAGERFLGFDDFHTVFGEFRVHNLFDPVAFIAEDRPPR